MTRQRGRKARPGKPSVRIRIDDHPRKRMKARGTTSEEVTRAILEGERFPGKEGRRGFRLNFPYSKRWRGTWYATKQVEVFARPERGWIVVTVITRYF